MKKFLSLALSFALLASFLPLAAVAEETLTIERTEHASFTYNMSQPVIRELEKRLGVKIQLNAYPSADYNKKLKIQLATDDLPDIIFSTYTTLDDYVPEDMFINLSDYMDKLPNYQATLSRYADLTNAFKVDGDMYWFIMTAENAPAYGNFPMVRQDILEKIGWNKMPEDFDELYEMLKAIKAAEPASIPMVTRGVDVLWRMGYSFGTYNNIYYEPDHDQYEYGPLYGRYKTFLEYLNLLYREGLLDPDFAASNKSIWMEYLTSGKSYFFFENGSFATDINLVTTADNKEARFVPMTTLKNYFGSQRAMFFEGSGVISPFRNDVWAISSALTGEKLDTALKFMDYLYSDEGAKLCSYGVLGSDYTVDEEGNILFDQEKIGWYLKNANDPYREYCNEIGIGCLALSGRFYDDAWYQFMDQDSRDMYAFWLNDPNITVYSYTLCLNAEDTERVSDLMTACKTHVETESLKFIMGMRPFDEYETFAQELKDKGAQTIEEIYNKAYQISTVK